MLKTLASEEDVADLLNMYTEFCDSSGAMDPMPLHEQQPIIRMDFKADGTAGIGVEPESSMLPRELSRDLGFVDGRPFLFTEFRHTGGLTAWDEGDLFERSKAAENPDMEPLSLHWHQLCGVHALLRLFFSPESTPAQSSGALIADDVGIGKTFQVLALIAFLTDLNMRQKIHGPLPPIIRKLS